MQVRIPGAFLGHARPRTCVRARVLVHKHMRVHVRSRVQMAGPLVAMGATKVAEEQRMLAEVVWFRLTACALSSARCTAWHGHAQSSRSGACVPCRCMGTHVLPFCKGVCCTGLDC